MVRLGQLEKAIDQWEWVLLTNPAHPVAPARISLLKEAVALENADAELSR